MHLCSLAAIVLLASCGRGDDGEPGRNPTAASGPPPLHRVHLQLSDVPRFDGWDPEAELLDRLIAARIDIAEADDTAEAHLSVSCRVVDHNEPQGDRIRVWTALDCELSVRGAKLRLPQGSKVHWDALGDFITVALGGKERRLPLLKAAAREPSLATDVEALIDRFPADRPDVEEVVWEALIRNDIKEAVGHAGTAAIAPLAEYVTLCNGTRMMVVTTTALLGLGDAAEPAARQLLTTPCLAETTSWWQREMGYSIVEFLAERGTPEARAALEAYAKVVAADEGMANDIRKLARKKPRKQRGK